MSPLEVREQVKLSWGKCLELVLNGIQFRLFRSMITVTIIALAVAFLMTMLCEGLVGREVAAAIETKTAPRRTFLFWVSRISAPLTHSELTEQMANLTGESPRWREFAAWGGLSGDEMERLVGIARQEKVYVSFLDRLDEGVRRPLVGRARGAAVLAELALPERFEGFVVELRKSGLQLPTSIEEFQAFLGRWSATGEERQRVLEGAHRALDEVLRNLVGNRRPVEYYAQAGESMAGDLGRHGFLMSADEQKIVHDEAVMALDAERITRTLGIMVLKRRLAMRVYMDRVGDVTPQVLFEEVRTAGGVEWFLDQMRRLEGGFALSGERVRQVAQDRLEDAKLSRLEAAVMERAGEGGFMGFSMRVAWLIVVSLVVCVVGIANAMLMSVTERFREIATMKCLGSTDGFIMVNFMLESCLQGGAGGLIGAVLGFLLGVVRAWATYGTTALGQIPWTAVVVGAGAAVVTGVVISALAAVYPAWVAARLAPMEAMRVE